MPRSGPRKIQKYSVEFKVTAVRLSQQPGLEVQAVARALEWDFSGFLDASGD